MPTRRFGGHIVDYNCLLPFRECAMNKSFNLIHMTLAVATAVAITSYWAKGLLLQSFALGRIPVVEISEDRTAAPANYAKKYDFTTDWFSDDIPIWESVLSRFAGQANVEYLEVGVFEGRAAMWMLENILTHPSSRLTGIDLFEGQYDDPYPEFGSRYFANLKLSGAGERAETIKGYSQVELRKLPLNHYDIIYIDGSHENKDVLEDAILSMRLLKKDGVLIFDDYGRRDTKLGAPKLGIDAFFHYFGDQFKLLHNDRQILLKKL